MKRTEAEIDSMKVKLREAKSKLPPYSAFGDPNHKIIDYQLDVLNGLLVDEDEVWDLEESDSDMTSEACSSVRMIFDWVDGDIEADEIVDED